MRFGTKPAAGVVDMRIRYSAGCFDDSRITAPFAYWPATTSRPRRVTSTRAGPAEAGRTPTTIRSGRPTIPEPRKLAVSLGRILTATSFDTAPPKRASYRAGRRTGTLIRKPPFRAV